MIPDNLSWWDDVESRRCKFQSSPELPSVSELIYKNNFSNVQMLLAFIVKGFYWTAEKHSCAVELLYACGAWIVTDMYCY